MVPKVAGKGRSFKGAGLYYLHDKQATSRDRVAFTHTENLPTRDPDKAIKCMAWTALRQQEIKARSGASAKGRKLTQPVYCYSLSWAPGEEPSETEMITAAKETLEVLGLGGHEALFVGHNDEPHPHIHVIVNRVHPETGIAAPLSMDHLRLSSWAEEFERNQGQIRCEQRVENNELRRQGEFVKDRESQHAAEFRRWQHERVEDQIRKRLVEAAVLDARQLREREDIKAARDREIEGRRLRLREATRAEWGALFRAQTVQERELRDAQKSSWARLRFFVRTHGGEYERGSARVRLNMLGAALGAMAGSKKQFERLHHRHASQRRALGSAINAKAAELIRPVAVDYERKLAGLRTKQGKEVQELREAHSRDSQEKARQIKQGVDRQIFEAERREQKRREVRELKDEVTNRKPRVPKNTLREKFASAKERSVDRDENPKTTLSEQFRRAKGEHAKTADKRFEDNAKDIGRERSATRKPKPDPD